MPSPQQQYEFRGGFGGRLASSAAPMNRTREPCRRRADYRRGGEAPQTSSAHLMLPGGPCTQSDEDLNHLMTIGSDRRCRRPKRSTSPRDEARSPHSRTPGKKSNKNTEQNSVCSSSPPAGAALTYKLPSNADTIS